MGSGTVVSQYLLSPESQATLPVSLVLSHLHLSLTFRGCRSPSTSKSKGVLAHAWGQIAVSVLFKASEPATMHSFLFRRSQICSMCDRFPGLCRHCFISGLHHLPL